MLWVADWTSAGPWADASWLEIAMLALALVATMVVVFRMRYAYLDMHAVTESSADRLVVRVARGTFIRCLCRLGTSVALVAMAVGRLLTGQQVSASAEHARLIVFSATVALSLFLIGSVMTDRSTRQAILAGFEMET